VDPLAAVSEDVRDALESAPSDERALLELRLSWPQLSEAEALIAARLRVFLLTWDPLGWEGDRGLAWATATGDGDSCEVVLYLMLDEAMRDARERGEGIVSVLGSLASSVLAVGGAHHELLVSGAYPQLAFAGEVPGLLSTAGPSSAYGEPAVELVSSGWEPIGLGAIQDLVQERFGPVDLDRSAVRIEPVAEPIGGCPACAGERFGFPADLEEARATMCPAHAQAARAITAQRLQRAQESNPEGWDAIGGASSMLHEPTFGLPLSVLRGLEEVALRVHRTAGSAEQLRRDAELALALAEGLTGKPEQFSQLMDHDLLSDVWLIELPAALASRGLVDEAVRVGDALAELDEPNRAPFASDVATILAEAGRREEALARVEQNLRRLPDDLWTQIHAGDVHLALSDPVRAEQAFRDALAMARARGDAQGIADANERLSRLLQDQPGREREATAAQDEMQRASRAAFAGARAAVKIGRNDPCPCGSGRKYKRCCGA
jgi:tetratricopeptide (TPR) repeat protein